LRGIVQAEIEASILDQEAWEHCDAINKAEHESLRHLLDRWKGVE